eukprot:749359-Hanusia_phi.AAC.2
MMYTCAHMSSGTQGCLLIHIMNKLKRGEVSEKKDNTTFQSPCHDDVQSCPGEDGVWRAEQISSNVYCPPTDPSAGTSPSACIGQYMGVLLSNHAPPRNLFNFIAADGRLDPRRRVEGEERREEEDESEDERRGEEREDAAAAMIPPIASASARICILRPLHFHPPTSQVLMASTPLRRIVPTFINSF